MKKVLDPNIEHKEKTVENRIQLIKYNNKEFPLPTEIEISESGICNRKCSFCPRSAPDFKDIKEFISKELISKGRERIEGKLFLVLSDLVVL